MFFFKVTKLVGGGSVINGPTLSSFIQLLSVISRTDVIRKHDLIAVHFPLISLFAKTTCSRPTGFNWFIELCLEHRA